MHLGNIIKLLITLFINYLKSAVLAWVVLTLLLPIFFIWTSFDAELSVGWLKYFSFLNPDYATGTFSMEKEDILKIFGVVSLVFFLIIELLEATGLKIRMSFRIGLVIISAIFGFAIVRAMVPPQLLNVDPKVIWVFLLFFVINLVSYSIWYGLHRVNSYITNSKAEDFKFHPHKSS